MKYWYMCKECDWRQQYLLCEHCEDHVMSDTSQEDEKPQTCKCGNPHYTYSCNRCGSVEVIAPKSLKRYVVTRADISTEMYQLFDQKNPGVRQKPIFETVFEDIAYEVRNLLESKNNVGN